jgi:hypothetical protein
MFGCGCYELRAGNRRLIYGCVCRAHATIRATNLDAEYRRLCDGQR